MQKNGRILFLNHRRALEPASWSQIVAVVDGTGNVPFVPEVDLASCRLETCPLLLEGLKPGKFRRAGYANRKADQFDHFPADRVAVEPLVHLVEVFEQSVQ